MKPLEDERAHRIIYDRVGREQTTLVEERQKALKPRLELSRQF
jgi:hypothetical protein